MKAGRALPATSTRGTPQARANVPMRLPTRFPTHHAALKVVAAVFIAMLATAIASGTRNTRGLDVPLEKLDDVLYDSMYGLRPAEDKTNADVVILTVDERSLKEVEAGLFGPSLWWPFPRTGWAYLIPYLQQCG